MPNPGYYPNARLGLGNSQPLSFLSLFLSRLHLASYNPPWVFVSLVSSRINLSCWSRDHIPPNKCLHTRLLTAKGLWTTTTATTTTTTSSPHMYRSWRATQDVVIRAHSVTDTRTQTGSRTRPASPRAPRTHRTHSPTTTAAAAKSTQNFHHHPF